MLAILSITFPIYAAIALGFALTRRGWFKPSDMKVLGGYVLNVALPALLFHAVATRPVGEVFNPAYMSVFLLGGLGTILMAWIWFRLTSVEASRRGVAVMGTSCPNSGFVGYPVMLLAFPDLAGSILAMNMLVENFVLIPTSLILMEMGRDGAHESLFAKLRAVILGVVKRPMVIALILGLCVSISGLTLPEPGLRFLGMLAASASALALFAIGGTLVGLPLRGNRALAVQITLGKLVLHPTLVFAALVCLGAGLSSNLQAAVILSAAMPIFTIYPLFAMEHGRESIASLALLGTTVASFATLTILLGFLT
ncbi:AEC family transporter [Aliiroseovarius subalbicans]|uniref:AEC family transporter n=1 Tax=Aliiroseovarius subalbicans TaxID=2925840 RepID=UPI001F5A8362|nr:AEC family transporter [Aliiroseovarius subalbicans]MCI2399979.1 AEC family transporter [Aliiroseovarius subalbicans]